MADPGLSTKEIWQQLVRAGEGTHPAWRRLPTTHWVMNLEWYKAISRASLPPDLPPDDETRWEPQPGDMLIDWQITVTGDGGRPHLVDGRAAGLRARIRQRNPDLAGG